MEPLTFQGRQPPDEPGQFRSAVESRFLRVSLLRCLIDEIGGTLILLGAFRGGNVSFPKLV